MLCGDDAKKDVLENEGVSEDFSSGGPAGSDNSGNNSGNKAEAGAFTGLVKGPKEGGLLTYQQLCN